MILKNCSFCGNAVKKGCGKMFVKNDGTVFTFCSQKCEKNLRDLGRDPKKTRWTEAFAKAKKLEEE